MELVVVVTIIGIIASIAIPRLSQGSQGANDAAVIGDLRIMQSAILRYAAEHAGAFPGSDADTVVEQMCQYSNGAGATSAAKSGAYLYGPYLTRFPPCPIGHYPGNSDIAIDATNSPPKPKALTAVGWIYNPNTGEIIPNAAEYISLSGERVIADAGAGKGAIP